MSVSTFTIREIKQADDEKIAQVIRSVFIEMGIPKVGTAYEDKALDHMTKAYCHKKSIYFVIAKKDEIFGGAGIAPLSNHNGNICELQKMYFMPKARGKGLGQLMMQKCLAFAKNTGFKKCYLESMPIMHHAQHLYKKMGFKPLANPMGTTGHYSCKVWMLKDL